MSHRRAGRLQMIRTRDDAPNDPNSKVPARTFWECASHARVARPFERPCATQRAARPPRALRWQTFSKAMATRHTLPLFFRTDEWYHRVLRKGRPSHRRSQQRFNGSINKYRPSRVFFEVHDHAIGGAVQAEGHANLKEQKPFCHMRCSPAHQRLLSMSAVCTGSCLCS